ncbi:PD-(D/E)XK nuclease family protein [Granulicella sp. L60]|uniref:PD-(D/E)XK nuclease family protein n=1 Tax=Granulicella sp. L60 TaxID=1641866 RepID=UPI00131D6F08|nr:PD-(D/E)XK nuclease family protein [Granulicella sp. L60]
MDVAELLPVEIIEALERGATVVTGNQRAARTLQHGFDLRNKELGHTSWTPTAVTAWETWTTALWRELLVAGEDSRLLLNRSQEHAVWRTVLEADEELASLKTVETLAEMAAEAWRLLWSYEGQRKLRGSGGSSDARAFQRWAQMMEGVCRTEGFVTHAQLEEVLRSAVQKGQLAAAKSGLVLVGFDTLTPARETLLETMRTAGMSISELPVSAKAERTVLVEATEEQEELRTAARWIRSLLESQEHASVAVIVPGLESERREIDRVFRELLAPELEDIRAGNEIGPYEFSLGVALSETQMASVALDLLRWAMEALPLERVSILLLSPYVAVANEERGPRAEFDAFELRKKRMLRPEISLEAMVALIEGSRRRSKLGHLLSALRRMDAVARRIEGLNARSHADWADAMRELLEAAGWGAGVSETSVEFQTRQRWESAFDELVTLDFDGISVDFAHALTGLERITRQTVFAPESREAPVQIMGPLEAAGSRFDAVWFLRAGEFSWPMETRSSSLLPWTLQRELEMPGTDVARDSEEARRMTKRIAESAATVVFSYAHESKDGTQRPSPVLHAKLASEDSDVPHQTVSDLEFVTARELIDDEPNRIVVSLEELEDIERVGELPDRVIPGGARILELQAACGFRAFAEQRLWATELASVEPGMDARESGTVVHKALELFWDEVKTQDQLRSMTEEEREEALEWSIREGLKRTAESSSTAWDIAYVEVQRERLRRLLRWWLELELERALPFEVRGSETEFADVHVGPLRLSVRMDRVDMVEGGEILIDYKTGDASPSDWLTERPDAPQLPLYAILSKPESLQGVAFGLVRAGEGRDLKGYSVGHGVLPKISRMKAATLEDQIAEWRRVLVNLAEEFANGDARVRPKTYPATCAHCGQRLLCRLDVTMLDATDEDLEEANRG